MHPPAAGMRTNIDIDDALIARAIRACRAKAKKAAMEQGLRLLIRLADQHCAVEVMHGLAWGGDLEASREARAP